MSATPALEVVDLDHGFAGRRVIDRVSLQVRAGEFFCLLGPSGCGKTTLLRLIGGYLQADAGRVRVAGEDITGQPLERRGIGMVFQSFALFPHLSARGNVEFGLAARGVPRAERRRRADAALERVGLAAPLWPRLPATLSGGEQQRVALARALVIEPRVLLLDEPMASLDRRLREVMRGELKALQQRTGVTTVLVTHDQEDAMFLADRIGIMNGGRLLQVDTPETAYRRPVDAFVAGFLGDANVFEVTAAQDGGWRLLGGPDLPAAEWPGACTGGRCVIRPEHLRLTDPARVSPAARGTVHSLSFLGAVCALTVQTGADQPVLLRMTADAALRPRVGDPVGLEVLPGAVWPLA